MLQLISLRGIVLPSHCRRVAHCFAVVAVEASLCLGVYVTNSIYGTVRISVALLRCDENVCVEEVRLTLFVFALHESVD